MMAKSANTILSFDDMTEEQRAAELVTSSNFKVVVVKNGQFTAEHTDFGKVKFSRLDKITATVGDKLRLTLAVSTSKDQSWRCVKASVLWSGNVRTGKAKQHKNINSVDALTQSDRTALLDGQADDIGTRLMRLMAARYTNPIDRKTVDASVKNCASKTPVPESKPKTHTAPTTTISNRETEPTATRSTATGTTAGQKLGDAKLSDLPVDRANLHVFKKREVRAPITDNQRIDQPIELHGELFIVVGFVDTTLRQCVHAYSATCGHAIINLGDFDQDLSPVGTWIKASIEMLVDPSLDPIIWRVTKASIVPFPTDQWSNTYILDECIITCSALVVELTDNGQLVGFNDVLFRVTSSYGASVSAELTSKIQSMRSTLTPLTCVRVEVQFSTGLHWQIVDIHGVDTHAKPLSNVLLTSNRLEIVRSPTIAIWLRHEQLGKVLATFPKLAKDDRAMFALVAPIRRRGPACRWVCIANEPHITGAEPKLLSAFRRLNPIDDMPIEFLRTMHENDSYHVGERVREQVVAADNRRDRQIGQHVVSSKIVDVSPPPPSYQSTVQQQSHAELLASIRTAVIASPDILLAMTKYSPVLVTQILSHK